MAAATLPEMAAVFLSSGGRTAGMRRISAWNSALRGAAGSAVLPLALRHLRIQEHLLMASLPAITGQAAYQRKSLLLLAARVRRLQGEGRLAARHADAVLQELARTERELASLERRAATDPAGLVSTTIRTAVRQTLPAVSSARFTELVRLVSEQADPAMHARLSRIFEAGPLGSGAWVRLASAIEENLPRGGSLFGMTLGQVGELLSASHPGYREVIDQSTRAIVGLGLGPVEVIGDSWLLKAAGAAQPKKFRDGLLLAVTEPASGFHRIGEAGIAVTLESRQALAKAEAATAAEAAQQAERAAAHKKPFGYDRSAAARAQQTGAAARTDVAIEEGSILLTNDGSLYRLRPMPPALVTNVLSRPYLLQPKDFSLLRSAASTAAGHPGNLIQIVPPFNSEFLRPYVGRLISGLQKAAASL